MMDIGVVVGELAWRIRAKDCLSLTSCLLLVLFFQDPFFVNCLFFVLDWFIQDESIERMLAYRKKDLVIPKQLSEDLIAER